MIPASPSGLISVFCSTLKKALKMYSAQINVHLNIIVCKGTDIRNSYRIIYTGSYDECLRVKALGLAYAIAERI